MLLYRECETGPCESLTTQSVPNSVLANNGNITAIFSKNSNKVVYFYRRPFKLIHVDDFPETGIHITMKKLMFHVTYLQREHVLGLCIKQLSLLKKGLTHYDREQSKAP